MAMKKFEKMNLKGKFIYYDTVNENGRMYTKECAEDIVKQFEELDHRFPMVGQLGYPEAEDFKGKLGDVSHKIKEIHINPESHAIEGTLEILDTPNGHKLLGLIKNDMTKFTTFFVVRPRGTGEVNENKEVVNYKIISFDIVPKETDAFKNNQ
jgi:hypothetical protein